MRVLSVNDLSCIGKCSLSVTLPIVSACGVTCDVLPTALLSTHTGGFEGYTFDDLTDRLPDILNHWEQQGEKFDVLYSGYLGSKRQIDMILDIKHRFLSPDGILIVDPVMGDSGTLYAGFENDFPKAMLTLCKEADFILPNHTEACLLADMPYPSCGKSLLKHLSSITKRPIITGVEEGGETAVYTLDKNGDPLRFSRPTVEGFFCGSGDVFASAFVGSIAIGLPYEKAAKIATEFTSACIARSATEVLDHRYGLNFEKEIPSLLKLIGKI